MKYINIYMQSINLLGKHDFKIKIDNSYGNYNTLTRKVNIKTIIIII